MFGTALYTILAFAQSVATLIGVIALVSIAISLRKISNKKEL